MKRKVLSLALGLCMVFSLMIGANAAASPTEEVVPSVSGATASDGTVIPADDIKASAPAADNKAVQAVTSAASTSAFLAEAGLTSAVSEALAGTGIDVNDLVPAATFDVTSAGVAAEVIANGGTVELSFEVPGISDGDVVVVLVCDASGNWVQIPAVVRGGKVVGQFNTLGTVVIMTGAEAEAAGDGHVTSPQTSGANLEGVLICGAVLSLAVLALCIKRSRMA